MVVDCLTKERYYILYNIDENNITTEAITQLFFQDMWKLYSLPSSITSDRGP